MQKSAIIALSFSLLILSGYNIFAEEVLSSYERSWKCSQKGIVNVGDSKGDVLNMCGEPTSKEIVGVKTKGNIRGKSSQTYSETSEIIEEWYYNNGPKDFTTTLIFTGSELTKIKRGTYGK